MLVIVKQLGSSFRRLYESMALGQPDVCHDLAIGQPGHDDAAMLRTADRQWHLLFAQLTLTLRVVNKIDAAQIASSQRTSTGGRDAPGRTLITLRTSR